MQVLCAFRIEQCCKEGELMISGFDTALGEVTLVLFTTFAPSGAIALVLVAAVLLLPKLRIDDAGAHQHVHVHPPCGYHGGACRVGHASWEPGNAL